MQRKISHPTIGVIVPIYNVEKYIAECIESILMQTYTNFRLILVDDGTPDNAGKICDEYAKKDSRITVIHQENAGVTQARARGVEEAEDCEFITFVDGDDSITRNALSELIGRMTEDCEIVIGTLQGYDYYRYKENLRNNVTRDEYLHSLISRSNISPAPWAKLFRKELFTEETFKIPRSIIYGEDLLMNIKVGSIANKINILHRQVYNYRNNTEGCDNTFRTTPEYEQEYFKQMLLAIPKKDSAKYYKDTIKRRVLVLEKEIGYKCRPEKKWFGSDFQEKLLDDIIKHKFRYPLIKKLLLKVKSPYIRYHLILLVKIGNIVKRMI